MLLNALSAMLEVHGLILPPHLHLTQSQFPAALSMHVHLPIILVTK